MNAVVLLALAATLRPGDLITIQAKARVGEEPSTSARAGCLMVVRSPLFRNTPIFLAQGWERSKHLADGMLVRAYVHVGNEVKLIDGIQMSDGRVWCEERIYERAARPGPPGQMLGVDTPPGGGITDGSPEEVPDPADDPEPPQPNPPPSDSRPSYPDE